MSTLLHDVIMQIVWILNRAYHLFDLISFGASIVQ